MQQTANYLSAKAYVLHLNVGSRLNRFIILGIILILFMISGLMLRTLPITILLISYQRKEFLIDALKSVERASKGFTKINVIIAIDFDINIPEKLTENLEIRIIKRQSSSYGETLSMLIDFVEDDFVAILEDDDLFADNKLQTLHTLLESTENVGYIWNNHRRFKSLPFSDKALTPESCIKKTVIDKFHNHNEATRVMSKHPDFNGSSITVRRDILVRNVNGLSKIKMCVDSFLFSISLNTGYSNILCDNALTFYREHDSSSVSLASDENLRLEKIFQIHKRHYEDYQLCALYTKDLILKDHFECLASLAVIYANRAGSKLGKKLENRYNTQLSKCLRFFNFQSLSNFIWTAIKRK